MDDLGFHSFRHEASSLLKISDVNKEDRKACWVTPGTRLLNTSGRTIQLIAASRKAQNEVVKMLERANAKRTGTRG